jgi:hypothetical protein
MRLPKYKSPKACGGADSYYSRPQQPHYYDIEGRRVDYEDMRKEQVREYYEGFDENEKDMNFKDWR